MRQVTGDSQRERERERERSCDKREDPWDFICEAVCDKLSWKDQIRRRYWDEL